MSGLPQVNQRTARSHVVAWATAPLLLLLALEVLAQVPPPEQIDAAPAAANVPAVQAPAATTAQPAAAAVEVSSRLDAIDAAIAKFAEKASKPDYTPVKYSLAGTLGGVLIGGLVTIWVQRRILANQLKLAADAATNAKTLADARATQDRELAQDRAALEVRAEIVQWRLKRNR